MISTRSYKTEVGESLEKVVPNKVKWVVKFVKKMEYTFPLSVRHGRKRETKSLEKKLDLTSDLLRVNEDETS